MKRGYDRLKELQNTINKISAMKELCNKYYNIIFSRKKERWNKNGI